MTTSQLSNWLAVLDRMVGDTEAAISERRRMNADAVAARDDVQALIRYMNEHEMPPEVIRAIERCLFWNPHCSKRDG